MRKLLFFLLFFPFLTLELKATHIRAGEIIARRISSDCNTNTYVFDIIGYTDTGSTVEFGGGLIDFGNGEDPIPVDTNFPIRRPLGDGVEVTIFTTEPVTFGSGTFTISFREFNRNDGVLNMSNSVETPFYIETQIKIDPNIGCNNSPILTVPPVDNAAQFLTFYHNPGAYDPDGDSLSYRLVVCKQDVGRPVANYEFPQVYDQRVFGSLARTQAGDGPSTFTLNQQNGDLIWDAPAGVGEYNVAFQVVEWRKIFGQWREIGYVTRDMQILVEETDNNPPELILPPDTCVVAGTAANPSLIQAIFSADDPDGGTVKIDAFGGPFQVEQSRATYSPSPDIYQPVVAEIEFEWNTICGHVRERPYEVTVRATDDGTFPDDHTGGVILPGEQRVLGPQHSTTGPLLSTFDTWNITVVGPAPTGLQSQVAANRTIQLNWDPYSCPNAIEMQVWRKVDSYEFTPAGCEVGIPLNSGYQLIQTLPIGTTSYLDDNAGEFLAFGANYCYRLVAIFPQPTGGVSYASDESCTIIEAEGPVITHVSINPFTTSETNGEIRISWLPPVDADVTLLPPPYTYILSRAEGFSGNDGFTPVTTTTDTTFLDQGLNTLNTIYRYQVSLYTGTQNPSTDPPAIKSATASAVRLEANELFKQIELTWEAAVPWSNQVQDYPYHYIYRDHVTADPSEIRLIDSVNVVVDGLFYLDDGRATGEELSNETEYCYYVTTSGSYGNDALPISQLLNDSQIICAQPNDNIAPCPPLRMAIANPLDCEVFLGNKPCDFADFSNTITWAKAETDTCDTDVRSYNIYYTESINGTYELLVQNVRDTFYVDINLPSLARCYRITAVDRSGNESAFSEPICNDNCPSIQFPNAITPNGDGFNDTFRPFYTDNSIDGSIANFDFANCPRFVKSIKVTIVNRWGGTVFSYESGGENSLLVDWDGTDMNGKELSAGVYYYSAEVEFIRLNPADAVKTYKGWIHVLR
ncbi:gliding motility-associated C-terminal domain-containing protein [Cytophagales bacterium LB-30]|uniref:Gliding motility-associated C-terminal domain-containing protein n=1 Tax=Shiella aurantiaca TaxID=3058365 RepID=A0ABT8F544_9BACT|nr:gliding motility-associated C-terminal domain-containing protein [Shiella aurantiaca]MDN4165423.1 gliding motility-associated C-terminal domain-containing protein [Shiella aurantiaca]